MNLPDMDTFINPKLLAIVAIVLIYRYLLATRTLVSDNCLQHLTAPAISEPDDPPTFQIMQRYQKLSMSVTKHNYLIQSTWRYTRPRPGRLEISREI